MVVQQRVVILEFSQEKMSVHSLTLPSSKGPPSQSYGFSSSHVWIWELDYKESRVLKNWCFWIVLEKTLESSLDYKEIQPVYPNGDQSWVFIGRPDTEAQTLQYLGHLMGRADSFEKTLMLGNIEGRRRRGWHRIIWLDDITNYGHEFDGVRRWWKIGKSGVL